MTISIDDPSFAELRAWFEAKLDHALSMLELQIIHEITWGVPCGPTLSMVEQPKKQATFEKYLRGDFNA